MTHNCEPAQQRSKHKLHRPTTTTMVSYTASSTKLYMQAMEPLMLALQLLELPEPKTPKVDTDPAKITAVDTVLAKLGAIDYDAINRVGDQALVGAQTTPAAAVADIEARCRVVSQSRDLAPDEVFGMVKATLVGRPSAEELQLALFDILGFDEFELIGQIIEHQDELAKDAPRILTAEERVAMLADNQRKAKNEKLAPRASHSQYPHVFKTTNTENIVAITGKKQALPQGTTRTSYPTHEELVIPAPEQKHNRFISEKKLIRVAELDYMCQGTFKGYKTLNKMQSLVYPVAYNTNENMLVCAPTGAGKTDVAMLTILHCIGQFVSETADADGEILVDVAYDEFKIVYVAPLKALAAEIVEKYLKKLAWLGIKVRELTGDMQLLRAEIMATQIIVTTPEKWDVVTRKANGDLELVAKLKLLIIDEVHLLHEDRGSVIETLVARTLRQVELTQLMIRVVGLSATLPNYMDVADFLGVNRQVGMFYFDQLFRPVPLAQELCGVRGKAGLKTARENIDRVLYDKLSHYVSQGLQVMVFVHLRGDTVKSSRTFISMARDHHEELLFDCLDQPGYERFKKDVAQKNRLRDMRELFALGFGVHHAGLLRTDRNLTEKMFEAGAIKVLCCTATLAWGVNLPAAVVIVKGTQVYDAKQGGFVDLGISDVIQIFGRAGRPQYELVGTGILCTTSDRLDHYVSLIAQQHPIELRLMAKIVDNLNAEISLGLVTNVDEGVRWLGYTYLMVRMRQNPFAYGIDWKELQDDPLLMQRRRNLVVITARRLHLLQMIVFDEEAEAFTAKDLGRIALDFYLLNTLVEVFNLMMTPTATEADVLAMIAMLAEFDGIKLREDEKEEIKQIVERDAPCQIGGDVELAAGKTNALLQAYVSQAHLKNLALVSDSNYVAQNAARICRALFLIAMNRRWGGLMKCMLAMCQLIDRRMWWFDHPLAQFDLPEQILRQLRAKNPLMAMLRDMDAGELGLLVNNQRMGTVLLKIVDKFPYVGVELEIFPVTAHVMRVQLTLEPDFVWDERYHGHAQYFWITVEVTDNSMEVLHCDKLILNRRQLHHTHDMNFMIPLSDPLPGQVVVRVVLDLWIGLETVHAILFQHLIRPCNDTVRTNLLRLRPLPLSALHAPDIERLYKFRYFNPMQTMVFHLLYNTNDLVFVGSPTGSGKTVVAELAIWHAFNEFPGLKVVYIAPMKALVRERVDDWRARIAAHTPHKVVELTGDSLPLPQEIRAADIVITTPEKFDGILRNWQTRKFVQQVSLVIMDEIHLLALDRGPILEMIVSRMNYISSHTKKPIRLLGMSTAVSNAIDMAGWLGVKLGLFNFPSLVRPVPLQMYIDGFADNLAFCPLMKTMNKPAFMAIKQHLPTKPVLIFVASRRQTRLTALDLIHLCGMEANPRRFLNMDDFELQDILKRVKDDTLRLSLQFGMGLHHAGLVESDRKISHTLFEQGKIQILVATLTLAWGVNLPAHLVIIKGTQFFDSKIEGYRDMDLTDILQMMGRAGRPAYDTLGTAIVYTKESKKVFYKHFLNVGFPVESSLHKVLDDHLGAEISSGTITTRPQAMEFLTWTFLYRRAHNNPTYYGIDDMSSAGISEYLTKLIDSTLDNLEALSCLVYGDKQRLIATPFLHILSYYYLSHMTMRVFVERVSQATDFQQALQLLALAAEYDDLATRHGEELINMEMLRAMRYPAEDLDKEFVWDPHVKAYLLMQAFMSRVELPIADYTQDTVSVLDQALRILQAYIDAAAEYGYFKTVTTLVLLMVCLKQRQWYDDCALASLPGVPVGSRLEVSLKLVAHMGRAKLDKLMDDLQCTQRDKFVRVVRHLPVGRVTVSQTSRDELEVVLVHDNPPLLSEFKVWAPHFPKQQRELWFVIVSDESDTELLMLKRALPTMAQKKGRVRTVVDIPGDLHGRAVHVHLINDGVALQYKQSLTLE